MSMDIENKVNSKNGYAFVSGATGVIGKHFALAYAKNGYNLYLTGRDAGKLDALRGEISGAFPGIDIICFPCELADGDSRDKMYGHINALGDKIYFSAAANVAGIDDEGFFIYFTTKQIRDMLRVNVESTIEITHFLVKHRMAWGKTADLKAAPPFNIITVSSLSAYFKMPLMALYSTSKRALYHFFGALREEVKDYNIRFTVVLPGAVPTRPDLIDRIKSQGFFGRISSISPGALAAKSIRKADKNKLIYVPGLFNKFLRTMSFIIPSRLVSKIAGARWKSAAKKAARLKAR